MRWNWLSYLSGVATLFAVVVAAAVVYAIASDVSGMLRSNTLSCGICHRTLAEDKPRFLLMIRRWLHLLSPAHKRALRVWWRGTGPEDSDGNVDPARIVSMPATFDRKGRVTGINGHPVMAHWGNGVYLLEDMLLRIGPWKRGGGGIRTRLCEVRAIPLGDIETLELRTRVGRYAVVSVCSKDWSVIRIPSPHWQHWRLMPKNGREWCRAVSNTICAQSRKSRGRIGGDL